MDQGRDRSMSAEPRPAATLVLARDSVHGPEVLLTRRPDTMRFMGGATVFPGGAVADADRDPRWEQVSAITRAEASAALDLPGPEALGAFVAAMRESFEEVGLLLVDGEVVPTRGEAASPSRFLESCVESGIELRTDLLAPAGSWVTPLGAPVRFDTRFFVAASPERWEPDADPAEVEEAFWLTPSDALAQMSSGNLLMAPPTIEMLQRLEGHASVEEAIASVRRARLSGPGSVLSTRLSPLVHLVLAPNPGLMTGPGTNSYVVGSGPSAIVDPAVDADDYLDALLDAAVEPRVILVTHRHPDHIGGVAELARRTGATIRAFGDARVSGMTITTLGDGDVVDVGGGRLRALHTPGHSSDHLCFVLEDVASLFAGDTILGEGTAVIAPPDGDMQAYLGSLDRLRSLHIDRIYPGHFRPLDGGSAVIDHYIDHRRQREASILEAVHDGCTTEEEIVARVYTDTPPALHPVARFSVTAHLEMLEAAGRVRREDGQWRIGGLE